MVGVQTNAWVPAVNSFFFFFTNSTARRAKIQFMNVSMLRSVLVFSSNSLMLEAKDYFSHTWIQHFRAWALTFLRVGVCITHVVKFSYWM